MIDRLLSFMAPHLCCGCGKIGTLLCDNCKYNIVNEPYSACLACGQLAGGNGICKQCHVPYDKVWCVGERSGALQRLIGDFKFQRMYNAHKPLGTLLTERLDQLPPATIVVPVPTVASHIRQRGYDHTLLLAKQVAARRQLRCRSVIARATATKQRDASRKRRLIQAKHAFRVAGTVDPDVPYLLIDDVVTTGATVQYAAKALRDAGACQVWVAVVARQPLD